MAEFLSHLAARTFEAIVLLFYNLGGDRAHSLSCVDCLSPYTVQIPHSKSISNYGYIQTLISIVEGKSICTGKEIRDESNPTCCFCRLSHANEAT